jgi:hypothetical protein
MTTNYEKMCKWELEKAIFLQSVAVKLGMGVSGYGEVSVNPNSGYVYLWLEDHNFSLYMPINCELVKTDVWALWTNMEDCEEEEMSLELGTTLSDIEEWVESCETDAKGDESRA